MGTADFGPIPRCETHHGPFVAGCPGCQRYSRDKARERTRLRAYGRWPEKVSGEPARRHLRRLFAQGMTQARMGRELGVSRQVVGELMGRRGSKRTKRIPKQLHEKAMALRLPEKAICRPSETEAWPITRRFRALQVIGYSRRHIAELVGISRFMADRYTTGRAVVIRRSTFARCVEVYQKYSVVPATERDSGWVASMARARGYPGPMAWDEGDLDVFDAVPYAPDGSADSEGSRNRYDEQAVQQALSGMPTGELSPREKDEAVRRALKLGLDDELMATRLRIKTSTLSTIRARLGLTKERMSP